MWTDRYLKNALQLKYCNNVKLARVLAETLKISVNIEYCNSVGELIKRIPFPQPRWRM
jgi:hypothetical protein